MNMNSSFDTSYDSTMPEEFQLLCMLHNIGATTSEKSLPIEKISEWTRMEVSTVEFQLRKLVELEFVQLVEADQWREFSFLPGVFFPSRKIS